MDLDEYATYDGLGLADLVSRKEVTSAELCETARQAIEATNDDLNFLVGWTPAEAERCLDELPERSTFGGVPTLLKDIGPKVAGVPQDAGSAFARGVVPSVDSEIVRRWRQAGSVFIGRSTTPELGSSFTTESRVMGQTKNPWDLQRSTGGSSGGAAAAVSAGVVPFAMGGDSGGSIRIPSHCCGLFGFKPSRGRNPVGPESAENAYGFTVAHILTRSVRDSAAMLDATAGPDVGCRYFCPPPSISFLEATSTPRPGLRIAYTKHNYFGIDVDAEVCDAVENAAKLCADLGHSVEEATPPVDGEEMIDIFEIVWTAGMYYAIQNLAKITGRTPGDDTLEGSTMIFAERGATVSAAEYLSGLDMINVFTRKVANFYTDYDVVLTPVYAVASARLGETHIDRRDINVRELCHELFRIGAFTSQYNITGQPAMSVPLYQSKSGLPIGVQFIASFCDDGTLFALAGQLEKALPWSDRRPVISVGAWEEKYVS